MQIAVLNKLYLKLLRIESQVKIILYRKQKLSLRIRTFLNFCSFFHLNNIVCARSSFEHSIISSFMGTISSSWTTFRSDIYSNPKVIDIRWILKNYPSFSFIYFLLFCYIWRTDMHGLYGVLSAFSQVTLGIISK